MKAKIKKTADQLLEMAVGLFSLNDLDPKEGIVALSLVSAKLITASATPGHEYELVDQLEAMTEENIKQILEDHAAKEESQAKVAQSTAENIVELTESRIIGSNSGVLDAPLSEEEWKEEVGSIEAAIRKAKESN